jgi:hypothetical protein
MMSTLMSIIIKLPLQDLAKIMQGLLSAIGPQGLYDFFMILLKGCENLPYAIQVVIG